MKKYTKKQKNAYFKNLRKRWAQTKKLAENDQSARAIFESMEGEFSYYSFYFTLLEMRAKKLDGLPYIDCKTYEGWKKSGFQVKKDESSVIDGITWVKRKYKDEDGNELEDANTAYPKLYKLFHKSQTIAINY